MSSTEGLNDLPANRPATDPDSNLREQLRKKVDEEVAMASRSTDMSKMPNL
jgi:hypothetical protein